MEVVDAIQINSFAPVAQQTDVSPEESIFVLSASQLREIISHAIVEAIQPLQDEISQLKGIVVNLESKVAALTTTEMQDVDRICIDLATDRQRISKLEQRESQPLQRDRGEILIALIAANGGRMLAKEARQKMRLSKQLFSMLIASMKDDLEIKPLHSDKRKLVLTLK